MSPGRQQPWPGWLTCADTNLRDHGYAQPVKAPAWSGARTARDRRRQDPQVLPSQGASPPLPPGPRRNSRPRQFSYHLRLPPAVAPEPDRMAQAAVAQLRYSADTHHWSLYWADRNGRWHRYDDLDPGPVDKALNEIEADPTCIFWG